jgi:hypothetical protein
LDFFGFFWIFAFLKFYNILYYKMPQRIRMNIMGTNSGIVQINNPVVRATNTVLKGPSLNSSMIGRIHSAKPGCGSCGRH